MTMADYEYRRFDLPPNAAPSKEAIQSLLQPIGDDAWEITYIGAARRDRGHGGGIVFVPYDLSGNPILRWVDARRPPYGTPGPSSWEYTGFNMNGMPNPAWSEHLASRGWQNVVGTWYSYYRDDWHVYKRTDVWRGTDDGDIPELLKNLGFDLYSGALRPIVAEILDTKRRLSAQAGYDVGTQHAVESWRSKKKKEKNNSKKSQLSQDWQG
jgi:hypothetical protein